ncbi:MAG: hypothetical protein IPI67_01405 [Myxococcales bacterium]|nr:hypothetical protein [Myxococcales bacterium]
MSHLNQLTLRGLDPRLERAIRQLAKREKISLNKAALRLLEKGAGVGTPDTSARIGRSLDHLIGTWTEAQAEELLESIQACEQVDAELWE